MAAGENGGVVPALSARQLVDAVPGLADTGIDLEVIDFRQVPGASLTIEDLTALAATIREHLANGADGVVVTQGTDTMEETAYVLDLLHAGPAPVVVTGAMRNPTLAGADGPANLLGAIHTAASSHSRHHGVLVVMADEIHAARRVRKTHSTSVATFQSPTGGPLGYLVGGQPQLINHLGHRLVIPLKPDPPAVRTGLVTVTLGDDGALLHGLSDRLDGLVVAAFGVGHVPSRIVPYLEDLAARLPVVLTSRTGAGAVLTSTYAFPGSEKDLISRGLIPAGFLDPFKARILLHLLLTTHADRTTITAAFGAAGGYTSPEAWPWPTGPRPGW
jgi:L-asparaginase